MKIIIDKPCATTEDIYLIALEADIEVIADLATTAKKIQIVGKTLYVSSKLEAPAGEIILGAIGKMQLTSSHETISVKDIMGKPARQSALDHPYFSSGVHICAALMDRVSIVP